MSWSAWPLISELTLASLIPDPIPLVDEILFGLAIGGLLLYETVKIGIDLYNWATSGSDVLGVGGSLIDEAAKRYPNPNDIPGDFIRYGPLVEGSPGATDYRASPRPTILVAPDVSFPRVNVSVGSIPTSTPGSGIATANALSSSFCMPSMCQPWDADNPMNTNRTNNGWEPSDEDIPNYAWQLLARPVTLTTLGFLLYTFRVKIWKQGEDIGDEDE